MNELQQFHAMANEFFALLELPAQAFEPDQDHFIVHVEDRFTVRLGRDESGVYLLEGDWQEGIGPDGLHGDWLMANQICPGQMQPVMALNESGDLTCWLRLSRDLRDAAELVDAFDMLLDSMQRLTQSPDAQ